MGQKHFAPKLFHTLSLDMMVPKDHLFLRLEATVDLSFVRKLCAPYYFYKGQPSVDPMVLFKMMLLGYFMVLPLSGILAKECSLHLAFRWYLGYDLDEPTPDHYVVSKARLKLGKAVFEAFFQRVLKLCVEADLVGGEKIFADSTLVTANASVKSLDPREQLFQPVLSPAENPKWLFDENPLDSSDKQKEDFSSVTGSSSDSADAMKVYAEDTSIHQRDAPVSITSLTDNHMIDNQATSQARRGRRLKPRQITNILKVSRTDPDASIITRPGLGTILAYKEHFTVDSSHQVITAGDVTPAYCEGL